LKAQAKIYKDLGGTDKYDSASWNQFVNRVGWQVYEDVIYKKYEDSIYNTTINIAHLPVLIHLLSRLRQRRMNGMVAAELMIIPLWTELLWRIKT
jgi:GUN4-like